MPLDQESLLIAIRDFGAKRSHQDSEISNENSRSAGQAALLINGGAATAIASLFSRSPLDQHLLVFVPWAVALYACGVVCGALMIWCMNRALGGWQRAWFDVMKHPTPTADAGLANHEGAARWHDRSNVMFGISIGCFFIATGLMACGFLRMSHAAACLLE